VAKKDDIVLKHDIGILEDWVDRDFCARMTELFNEKFDANLVEMGMDKETPIEGGFTKNEVNFQHNNKRWDASFNMETFGRFQEDAERIRCAVCAGADLYFNAIGQNHPEWSKDAPRPNRETHQNAERLTLKVQRTPPGGGFNGPHCEQGPGDNSSRRYAVWMLYMNDVENGGHTAFPRHDLLLPPKAGTLVIWPAAFTHPHHGTPPTEDSWKMVITGWFTHPQQAVANDEEIFRHSKVEEGSD